MNKMIQQRIADAVLTSYQSSVNDFRTTLLPFVVSLTGVEKQGIRVMAEGREGYVRLLSRIALAHPDCLSRNDDPQLLADALDYDQHLEDLRQSLMALSELINNIQIANSKDIMQYADHYGASLQVGRSGNSSLDSAMHEIDDWNKRYGVKKAATDATANNAAPDNQQ
ncbi:hypothetical protein [Taibaiella soli]|uniref:Uncharacterized protein n=1 Tax=Taibaiella soli TaxID=1649169 RepID=A0A2W2A8B5_9BACT|nr:hypothetical protein [Taibaiella soli]PZF71501.1 hypothetical protein DN068_18210 [Taibaiella soli]